MNTVFSLRQDLKFTCREYESLWLEIYVGVNSNSSKNILLGLIYRHPEKSIQGFNKKSSDFIMENINSYKNR